MIMLGSILTLCPNQQYLDVRARLQDNVIALESMCQDGHRDTSPYRMFSVHFILRTFLGKVVEPCIIPCLPLGAVKVSKVPGVPKRVSAATELRLVLSYRRGHESAGQSFTASGVTGAERGSLQFVIRHNHASPRALIQRWAVIGFSSFD